MRIHIIFNDNIDDETALRLLREVISLESFNIERFIRYGILSGEIQDVDLPVIKRLDFVKNVSVDGI